MKKISFLFMGLFWRGWPYQPFLRCFQIQNSLIFGGIALHCTDWQIPKRQFFDALAYPVFPIRCLDIQGLSRKVQNPAPSWMSKIYFKTIRPNCLWYAEQSQKNTCSQTLTGQKSPDSLWFAEQSQKKIPSEMEVAPHCTLHTLLTLLTWFKMVDWYSGLTP